MAEAYIIDAVRTPRGIGKPGKGALSHLHPQHLAATVLAAIRDRNNLDTKTVDDVIWSTSTQRGKQGRSDEHTSELQSLMRISYAVFCLNTNKNTINPRPPTTTTSPSVPTTQILHLT